MKPNKSRTLLGALLAFALGTGSAAPAADASSTGTITGRVSNLATGNFLNNARVALKGTEQVALTDEAGTFHLSRVPAGAAVLDVFYTGLDPQLVAVQVAPGGVVVQDVGLTNLARYGKPSDAVKLDPFVVSTARDTDAHSIAINEQRFAPNLKNVVSVEAFGDVTDGNVGEFLKFLPGIATDNEDGLVGGVSIRGFGNDQTRISTDGASLANTGVGGARTRAVSFSQISVNNLARVEVTKSPTAADPADTMGGSVNFVTKSAFERKGAQLNYNLNLSGASRDLTTHREPTVGDKMVHKILPGVTFDYTLPVNQNFGIVVTGQSSDRYIQSTSHNMTYSTAAGAGASPANPFLSDFRFADAARVSSRRSVGLKADWRAATNSVVTVGLQTSSFAHQRAPIQMTLQPGASLTPNPATGKRLSFGPDFVSGATGRGVVKMLDAENIQQVGRIRAANGRYRFDNGVWKIEAAASYSLAIGAYRDINASPARFQKMTIDFAVPVRMQFDNIGEAGPRSIRIFDSNERELSLFDIRNYKLTDARQNNKDYADEYTTGKIDVRRRLTVFSFPLSVQAGAATRSQTRDIRHYQSIWNYTGPADLSYMVHDKYKTQGDSFFAQVPWVSAMKAWAAFQANPSLFTHTPAQAVTAANFAINQSQFAREDVDAFYGQFEVKPFSRLSLLGGVRYEKTDLEGKGALVDPTAVWVRSADGNFALTATGARIRKPEAGAVGSLEEVRLVRKDRGAHAARSSDGFYPSLHATYNITQNIIARASFAETYGRPSFLDIIPNTTITELDLNNDPNRLDGRISVKNPGLKPWSAKNYDLSLEYYTPQGGLFSVGAFRKDVAGFFVDETHLATEKDLADYELDPGYLGWEIVTSKNAGATRIHGLEFNAQHSLQPLGAWGRPFQLFINGSKLKQDGKERVNFSGFAPMNLNWGLNFNHSRIRVTARWNYVAERFRSLVANIGTNGGQYTVAKTSMDLNTDFRISPRLSVYANFNNILGVEDKLDRYADETPAHARRYQVSDTGILLTLGIKGTF